MRHSEKLIAAVARAVDSPDTFVGDDASVAIAILDAVRSAEAEEMKTDRQALVDTILDAGAVAGSRGAAAEDVADAILSDFHVSLREDETEPLRAVSTEDRKSAQQRAFAAIAALQESGKPVELFGDEFLVTEIVRNEEVDHGQIVSAAVTVSLKRIEKVGG